MSDKLKYFVALLLCHLAPGMGHVAFSQTLLDKRISIEASHKPLGEVLDAIGGQGHFYFSYNAGIVRKDSLVTIAVRNKTVRESLHMLLGDNFQYKETNTHVIIL